MRTTKYCIAFVLAMFVMTFQSQAITPKAKTTLAPPVPPTQNKPVISGL